MAIDTYPPYTPMPSLGHELELMLGFLTLCIVVMGVCVIVWRAFEARLQKKDLARRKALHKSSANTDPLLGRTTTVTNGGTGAVSTTAKGAFTISADGAHEKMLDRYTMPEGRVELPVHGMNDDMGVGVGRGIRSENSVDIGIRNGVGRAIGGAIGSGIGIGKMAGNGVENGVGVGVRNGIYGHERWDSSLTRIESPLSPISSLSLLGGSRSRTGVVSPTGIERVDVGAGFASAVGVALAAATEVGERCSLGRDIREGMSPVEIGPGIEVVAEKEEKEDGKTGQSTKQEVKEKWKEREKQERE